MLRDYLDGRERIANTDAARFDALDVDLCMLCNAYGADKRNVVLDCFYDVKEVVPEAVNLDRVTGPLAERGYYLRVCKACRGAMLDKLGEWRDERVARRGLPMDHDGHDDEPPEGANIPVRQNGRIVWLTREQWDDRAARAAGGGDG